MNWVDYAHTKIKAGKIKKMCIIVTEIQEFFESKEVWNHFSTHEQWQNRVAESTISSIMTISRTAMVESGLGGRFWFKAATAGRDERKVTYKATIKTSLFNALSGEVKGVS